MPVHSRMQYIDDDFDDWDLNAQQREFNTSSRRLEDALDEERTSEHENAHRAARRASKRKASAPDPCEPSDEDYTDEHENAHRAARRASKRKATAPDPSEPSDDEHASAHRVTRQTSKRKAIAPEHSEPDADGSELSEENADERDPEQAEERREIAIDAAKYELFDLPGRDPILGTVYRCKKSFKHPQVVYDRGPVGSVYIIVLDMSRKEMLRRHDFCANQTVPATSAERRQRGFFEAYPEENDFVLWRDLFGSGKAEDDIMKSYSICKSDYSSEEISRLSKLSQDLLGSNHREGERGIAFEQLGKLEHVKGAKRAYHVGTSNQTIRKIEGPSVNQKMPGLKLGPLMELHKRLLEAGATAGMHSWAKVDTEMRDILEKQGQLTNCAPLGISENVFWTSAQLNVASLTMSQVEQLRAIGTQSSELTDLGDFGKPHHDGGDHEGGITNMTNFTPPHPHVKKEYFTILDLGVAWRLDELCSVFFSGLHYHSGSPAVATSDFDGSKPYTRLTFIMYPSAHELNGDSRIAFAGTDINTSDNLLYVTPLMRNSQPHKHLHLGLPTSNAGNYVADGLTLMDDHSYLNFTAHNCLLMVLSIVRQAPPEVLMRLDRDKLLEAFSMVIDGKRVRASPWAMGPGWTGADVEEGTEYEGIGDLSPIDLAFKWNTDSGSDIPYGNKLIADQQKAWDDWTARMRVMYPLCFASREVKRAESGIPTLFRRPVRTPALTRAVTGTGNLHIEDDRPRKKAKTSATSATVGTVGSQNTSRSVRSRKTSQNSTKITSQSAQKSPQAQPSPTAVPRLFTALRPEALSKELTSLSADAAQEMNIDVLSVDAFGLSEAQTGDVYALAESCIRLDQSQSHHSLQMRARCQERMLVNMLLWEKLAEWKADAASALGNPSDTGFIQLASTIREWLQVRNYPLRLDAQDFLPKGSIAVACPSHTILPSSTRVAFGVGFDESAVDLAGITVMTWLGVDRGVANQRAALFTRLLFDSLGVEVLMLDEVWKASKSLSRRLMGRGNDQAPRPSDIENQVVALVDSIQDARTEVVSVLEAMHALAMKVRLDLGQNYFPHLVKAAAANANPPLLPSDNVPSSPQLQNQNPPHRPITRASRRPTIALPGRPLVIPSAGPSQSQSSATSSRSLTLRSAGPSRSRASHSEFSSVLPELNVEVAKAWAQQLTLCEKLIVGEGETRHLVEPAPSDFSRHELKYLRDVHRQSDKLFPFRDLAPSRSRVLRDSNGPFSPRNLRTREGFFSACVNRSLLHGTEFLLHESYPVLFTSAAHFREVENEARTAHPNVGESWFCRPSAYGQDPHCISLAKVEDYWTQSGKSDLTSWLLESETISFHELWTRIKNALKGTGPLRALLIATDYARAGIEFSQPDGYLETLREVNMGAVAGLRKLGLLPPKPKGKKASRVSPEEFTRAWNIADTWLRQNMKLKKDWDRYDTEHFLCKILDKRLGRVSWKAVENSR